MTKKDTVLIAGAGVGGMQAALLLAEAGYEVHLLDRAPALGGSMPLLDRTFPTNSCGLCFMSPDLPAYCPFIECERHPNIEILAYAEVESLEGEAGNFRVSILKKARYVDPKRCTGCGDCALVCPVEVPRELGEGLEKRKAIYRPYPQAIPTAYLIDREACTECGKCLKVCRAEAIDLEMEDEHLQLGVGAVILTPGFQPFPAELKGEFGYGRYPNVVTGFQFERMLSLTSPSHGLPQRLSDGQTPKRIAFIQCVGSRDPSQGRGYCSSVCCMYATKQAILAEERAPESEITLFYIDLRTFGKGYDRYLEQARKGYGINYQRSMVSAVKQEPRGKNLSLSYVAEDGRPREEEFDLVVLSTGFVPPPGAEELAQRVGIALNEYGFCQTTEFAPTETSRPGIFVAGAFAEPKDIAETVAEAASAAANAASLLGREAIKVKPPKEYPPEREVVDEEPRVGLFLCRCGEEIAQAVDLSQLRGFALGLGEVALVQEVDYACRPEGLQEIKEAITGEGLNRVVVAACTHRLYEEEMRGSLREAGLNPYLLERANLREECAWTHREPQAKAKGLIEMAVAKARLLKPLHKPSVEAQPAVLVIGGGLAGMVASLRLADLGFPITLVEKERELGGNLRHIHYTLEGSNPQEFLRGLVQRVESHPGITLFKGAEVVEHQGLGGSFRSTLSLDGEEHMVEHGATIVATGGQEALPREYLYGQDPRVITQRELEARIATGGGIEGTQSVIMIQCVGSREEGRFYCSRVCCSQAIKNAQRIKQAQPETAIFVLYRDMRTYGFKEEYYRRAREEGVIFIPYDRDRKPQVIPGPALRVKVHDPILGRELHLEADLLVLSPGIVAGDNGRLAEVLNLSLDEDGFFQEANPKVAPLDSGRAGIFLCGLAQGPKSITESISQAEGAAMRATAFLAKGHLEGKVFLPTVNARLCSGCGLCVSLCPYDARRLNEETRVAEVIEILCQGCGLCAMACPNGATQQNLYEMRQVMAVVDAAL